MKNTYMLKNKKNSRCKGITLMEVMVVVVIMGILAAVTAPLYMDFTDNAKKKARASNISSINDALDVFVASGGTLGSTTTVGSSTADGAINTSTAATIVSALTTSGGVWAGGQSHAIKSAPNWGASGAPAVTNGRLVQDGKP